MCEIGKERVEYVRYAVVINPSSTILETIFMVVAHCCCASAVHFEQSVCRSFRSKYGRQSLSEIRRPASTTIATLCVSVALLS